MRCLPFLLRFQEHVKTHPPKELLSTDEFLQLRQQYLESMRKAPPATPSSPASSAAGGTPGEEGGPSQMEIDEEEGADAPPPGVDDAGPPGVDDDTVEKEDSKALVGGADSGGVLERLQVSEMKRSVLRNRRAWGKLVAVAGAAWTLAGRKCEGQKRLRLVRSRCE